MRGRVGTDIGIKLLPVMWVFLCIPRYIHCSWSTVMAQAHSVMHTSIRACFLCFFYNPYMSLFNSKNFFIYLSPLFFYLFSCLLHDRFSPTWNWTNARSVGQCTQYINVLCSPCHTVLTAVATVSSPQFSHVILPVGSGSCTRFEAKSHGATQRARYIQRCSAIPEATNRSLAESGILWFSGVAPQG